MSIYFIVVRLIDPDIGMIKNLLIIILNYKWP